MRKNVKKVIAPLLAAAMALSCTVCVSAAEDETIKLTVWGAEEDQNLLKELTDKFQEKYADQKFDIQIGVESESTAKDTILTDVEAGADVYAFADDQLPDLVKAGALLKLDDYAEALQLADTTLDDVKAANVEGAIDAATIDGSLYAFPRAADNGYFLYYDSSVISEEDAASWDSLLEAADKAGKKVGMTLASGWYNASFFYGAGFTTGLNDDGTTTMDWNGTSADGYTGVDVVKGMLDITSNPAFMAVADGDMSNQLASGNLAACVSGTWDAITAKEIFGDGYAATKLPTFTVGDKQYRLKMIDVYNEQVNDLIKILPTFKIANATIHFDETSPHMHIVGVPIIENCTRGMKKQVGKSQLFTKESLTKIQDKMRNACIKSFNKFYGMDIKLKEKQKGKNQDINVKDMSNYSNIKKQLAEKEKKLDKAVPRQMFASTTVSIG